jgi:hypothetical protein
VKRKGTWRKRVFFATLLLAAAGVLAACSSGTSASAAASSRSTVAAAPGTAQGCRITAPRDGSVRTRVLVRGTASCLKPGQTLWLGDMSPGDEGITLDYNVNRLSRPVPVANAGQRNWRLWDTGLAGRTRIELIKAGARCSRYLRHLRAPDFFAPTRRLWENGCTVVQRVTVMAP